MRSNILCLETSAAKCSVALVTSDDRIVYKEANEAFSHVSQITLLIDDCIAESSITSYGELDAVAISGGPGSYTGLRVGTSTAKGICFAQDIPLISLNTLSIIAYALIKEESSSLNSLYIPVIDARRDEVYLAGFDHSHMQVMSDQAYILLADSFALESVEFDQIIIGGDAALKTSKIIGNERIIYKQMVAEARHMSYLALKAFREENFVNLDSYTPHYLKPPNITVSKKQFFRKN